jgi:hypothetical protein
MMPVRRVNGDNLPSRVQAIQFTTAEQEKDQENIHFGSSSSDFSHKSDAQRYLRAKTNGSFYKPTIGEISQSNGMILLIKDILLRIHAYNCFDVKG